MYIPIIPEVDIIYLFQSVGFKEISNSYTILSIRVKEAKSSQLLRVRIVGFLQLATPDLSFGGCGRQLFVRVFTYQKFKGLEFYR